MNTLFFILMTVVAIIISIVLYLIVILLRDPLGFGGPNEKVRTEEDAIAVLSNNTKVKSKR